MHSSDEDVRPNPRPEARPARQRGPEAPAVGAGPQAPPEPAVLKPLGHAAERRWAQKRVPVWRRPWWLVLPLAVAMVAGGWYAADLTMLALGIASTPAPFPPQAQTVAPTAPDLPPGRAQSPDPRSPARPGQVNPQQPAAPAVGAQEPRTAERPVFELPGPIAVSVDNAAPARPQSGLHSADIVYELPVEGGVTRLLAIFHSKHAFRVGPVRSARVPLVDLAAAHSAAFAHAGGTPEGLAAAQSLGDRDFDEIYGAGEFFWRSQQQEAPFNLYTNTQLLQSGISSRAVSLQPGPTYPIGAVPAAGSSAAGVELTFGTGGRPTRVEYRWSGESYARSTDGRPHNLEGGDVLRAENVVVMLKGNGVATPATRILGVGQAYFWRDGKKWTGGWRRLAETDPLVFILEDDQPMRFAAGRIWIAVFPTTVAESGS